MTGFRAGILVKTIACNNLGCSKNIIDGETILSFLEAAGFSVVTGFDKADIIVVNTCTFIQEATQEAIETILEMTSYKKTGSCSILIVSGCFSERYKDQVTKDFPEVDLWLGVGNWQDTLCSYLKIPYPAAYNRSLSSPLATQYIKISEGCSHACSYCIIPSIRGNFKSRTPEEIIAEAAWLSDQGVKECIVVSQDTSFYGRDTGSSLAHLLESLLKKTSFHWIRMMYLHPRFVDDNLLNLVASEKRICPYFDVPFQHVSTSILSAMHRLPQDTCQLYALVERIRLMVPDATIRTTFIAGFPGETGKEFGELVTFVETARFDKLGVFPFSPEEGTPASRLKHRPRNTTAMKRCETIMEIQKQISRELCEKKIGSVQEVIVDRISDNPDFTFEARTRGDAPEIDSRVFLVDGDASEGDFKKVTIINADDFDLFAKTV
jgi:ribosomal protein S12 methylthiotransferase